MLFSKQRTIYLINLSHTGNHILKFEIKKNSSLYYVCKNNVSLKITNNTIQNKSTDWWYFQSSVNIYEYLKINLSGLCMKKQHLNCFYLYLHTIWMYIIFFIYIQNILTVIKLNQQGKYSYINIFYFNFNIIVKSLHAITIQVVLQYNTVFLLVSNEYFLDIKPFITLGQVFPRICVLAKW